MDWGFGYISICDGWFGWFGLQVKSLRVFADLGGGWGGGRWGGWVERSGWWEKGGGGKRVTDDLGDIVYSRFFIFL